jgi:hypothetical protein
MAFLITCAGRGNDLVVRQAAPSCVWRILGLPAWCENGFKEHSSAYVSDLRTMSDVVTVASIVLKHLWCTGSISRDRE